MLGKALGGLFGANGWSDFYAVSSLKGNLFFLMVAILACAPIFPLLKRLFLPPEKAPSKGIEALCGVTGTILPVALLFLALIFLVGNTYNPFLYFQF